MEPRRLSKPHLIPCYSRRFAGCESPTNGSNGTGGKNGDPGVNSPNVVSTFRGIKDAFDEGNKVVYLVGPVDEASNWTSDLTLAAEQTLVIATNADIKDRSVAGSSVGSLTVPADRTLTVSGGTLKVNVGSKLAVAANGVLVVASGALDLDAGEDVLSLASGAGYSYIAGTITGSDAQKTALTTAGTSGPVRTTGTDSAINGLIHTDVVTTVIYSGTNAIPAGSPKTVPANKTLRALSTIDDQSYALTVDGTLVLTTATTFSGTLAIGEGGTAVLENTTTLSGEVSGKGALTLNRVAGTAITAAFASTGADTFTVGGTGAVSTDKETNIVKLLAGFNTVTYSYTTNLPAGVGPALTTGKALVLGANVAQSGNALALAGGTIDIGDSGKLTFSSSAVSAASLTGTGLVTVSVAAGLDLGVATAAPTGVKLQTTDSGTITTATTTLAVLNAILALNDGGTGAYASTGEITAGTTFTVPEGVELTASGSATFAALTSLTVNGTFITGADFLPVAETLTGTVSGDGHLDATGATTGLTLVNKLVGIKTVTVDAVTVASASTLTIPAGHTLTGTATFANVSKIGITVVKITYTALGETAATITPTDGTLTTVITGNLGITAGGLILTAGDTVTTKDVTISGGTITVGEGGTLEVVGGTGSSAAVAGTATVSSAVVVEDRGTLTVTGGDGTTGSNDYIGGVATVANVTANGGSTVTVTGGDAKTDGTSGNGGKAVITKATANDDAEINVAGGAGSANTGTGGAAEVGTDSANANKITFAGTASKKVVLGLTGSAASSGTGGDASVFAVSGSVTTKTLTSATEYTDVITNVKVTATDGGSTEGALEADSTAQSIVAAGSTT
jgi:hypothetical protein